jgi:hypothetical protein
MESATYILEPPLPIPTLSRDEFNAYKKTILQEYFYELIFHESDSEVQTCCSSPPGDFLELETPGNGKFEYLISQALQSLESASLEIIEEVIIHCDPFIL